MRVRNLRLMLDACAKCLADAEADAAVGLVESARMFDASADCLANAKANAADAPSSAYASADCLADAKADDFVALF